MATINGYTKERMKEIEDKSIVGAVVDAGHLILTHFDGTITDAGPVIGPMGPTGPPGPVNLLNELDDVNTAGAASGELLGFDGTNWVPQAPPVTSLDGLSDVATAGSDPGEALIFNGALWVPAAIPLPQKGAAGGHMVGQEGTYGNNLNTNSSTHQELNSGIRCTFVVPPSGKVCVVAAAYITYMNGNGHGGSIGVFDVADPTNPNRFALMPWGAWQSGMSYPAERETFSWAGVAIAPYTSSPWVPGTTKTLSMSANKVYGPVGGGVGEVLIYGNLQVFGVQ